MIKSFITSVKVISTLIILFTFSQAAVAKKGTEKIIIKTNIYCDHCKKCESCGGKLQKELFTKGIKNIVLDEKAMTISVTYNPEKITAEKIRERISKLGYDADEVKADAEAYQKLDGCCKKTE
ncbi:MAG TPA: cation transporter [Bacteroidia bacterium]|nr:cation transporter [Bacteroidia bacterium]